LRCPSPVNPCPAAENHDEQGSALNEVHTIAYAVMDAEFSDGFADRLHVAGIAEGETTDPDGNFRSCLVIAESRQSA